MSINVDETIKAVIKAALFKDNKVTFSNFDTSDSHVNNESIDIINKVMLDNLDKMNSTAVNRSYRAIASYGLKGKIKKLIKRVMRKLIFWYVEPCMIQQTNYNIANSEFSAEVNSEINLLKCNYLDNSRKIDDFYKKYNDLINNYQDSIKNYTNLAEKFNLLSQAYDNADKRLNEYISFSNDKSLFEAEQKLRNSYSQSGEDAIIKYVFNMLGKRINEIIYLDLGANHPKELSNTYSFYINGAHGVLIEANPMLISELKKERPNDIILNRCISDTDNELIDFYVFNGDGLSTSNFESAQKAMAENKDLKIVETVPVKTITIDSIIKRYFEDGSIDVLNIDVEGMELDILKSIDFSECRPMIIICEMIEYKKALYAGKKSQEIFDFLIEKGYSEYAFTGINSIFIDKKSNINSDIIFWG